MASFLETLRRRTRDYMSNMRNPPPFPEKLRVIAANRRVAMRHGCCGNPDQPGC